MLTAWSSKSFTIRQLWFVSLIIFVLRAISSDCWWPHFILATLCTSIIFLVVWRPPLQFLIRLAHKSSRDPMAFSNYGNNSAGFHGSWLNMTPIWLHWLGLNKSTIIVTSHGEWIPRCTHFHPCWTISIHDLCFFHYASVVRRLRRAGVDSRFFLK